jgi:cytochrome c oxidase cbb3-type subunit 1
MDLTVGVLLGTFILSVLALFVFIASMAKGLFGSGGAAAVQIFDSDELGAVEDPAATKAQRGSLQQAMDPSSSAAQRGASEVATRLRADQSSSLVVGVCLTMSVIWLVLASAAGLIASLKLHLPDWLVEQAWITFGRIRPVHLNMVAYGWCSMAGIGVAIWLIPRLLKTELVGARYALAGGALWFIGVAAGTVAIAMGHSDGLEWLEYPWQIDILLVIGGALVGFPLWLT